MVQLSEKFKFKEITETLSKLIKNDKNSYLMGVNWAQIIRYHPEYFKDYELVFKKNFFLLFVSLKFLKFICLIILKLIKSIFKTQDYKYKKKDLLDVVIISHFINKNHLSLDSDFYFGELPKKLSEDNIKINIVLNNHTNISPQIIEKKWLNSKVERNVFFHCLNFRDELGVIINGFKIFFNTLLKTNTSGYIIDRVRYLISVEAISPASLNAERLARQLEIFVKKTKPRVIIFTFEGHAWERLVIKKVKNLNIGVLCVGYVHTMAFPNQYASITSYQNEFMPDCIMVAGNETKNIFEKNLSNSIPIRVLGSHKKINTIQKFDKKKNIRILILPEGFKSETNLLFNFGLRLANQSRNMYIRIRLHPSMINMIDYYTNLIKEKKINNIKISTFTIGNDIRWSSHALYRGSTSIIEAVSAGVMPIYYNLKNELAIDPLFRKQDRSYYVSSVTDVILILENWMKMSSEQESKRKREFVRFCENLLEPLNIKVLKKVIQN